MHPRSNHQHMLEYISVRQRDVNEGQDTRAMRWADCGTEHIMLRSRMTIKRKMQHKRSSSKPPCRLGSRVLKDQKIKKKLKKKMNEKLEHWDAANGDLEQK